MIRLESVLCGVYFNAIFSNQANPIPAGASLRRTIGRAFST